MIGFALCHGWGFDAHALSLLQAALRRRFPCAQFAVFDLGFTGAGSTPKPAEGVDWIAVGHSWGFAWLMQQPAPWRMAVSLNGFTRFCRRPGLPEGTPPRLVDAMLARLTQDPPAVVREFRARCGTHDDLPKYLDRDLLHDHLIRLRDLDLALPSCPLLALATQGDAIVSPTLARACFGQEGSTLQEFAGDHLRLLAEPEPTVDAIAGFCEERL